jgi:hypothetical protein
MERGAILSLFTKFTYPIPDTTGMLNVPHVAAYGASHYLWGKSLLPQAR